MANSRRGLGRIAPAWLREATPGWLVEVVRPQRASPPWSAMLSALVSITAPIALGIALNVLLYGVYCAVGAMCAVFADPGGPYRQRVSRIVGGSVGGVVGFLIGTLVHGHGWWVVGAVVVVAVIAALLSAAGAVGSVFGLDLLVFMVIATGPFGAGSAVLGPALFLLGALWVTLATLAGWLLRPRAPEQSAVATVYRELYQALRAGDDAAAARERYFTSLQSAFAALLTARESAAGLDVPLARLITLLTHAAMIGDAAQAVRQAGLEYPPETVEVVGRLADVVAGAAPPCSLPERIGPGQGGESGAAARSAAPATRAFDAVVDYAVSVARGGPLGEFPGLLATSRHWQWPRRLLNGVRTGRGVRQYTARLTVCMAVAAVMSETLRLNRSYWVMLTVGIVLKPDFGSVFARAVQRGLGTVVGAVLGAAFIVAIPYGPLIIIPIAVLAGLLPDARRRNWGMFATFQAPLVILLVDLATHQGWSLVSARLLDTLLGCAIVLLLGYLPWPSSWYAPVGPRLAEAIEATADLVAVAYRLPTAQTVAPRRVADAKLNDLRSTFQRALAEPARVSRPLTGWWPAVVALWRLNEVVTATAVTTWHGGARPTADHVACVVAELRRLAELTRGRPEPPAELPTSPEAEPLVGAVLTLRRAIEGSLGPPG